MNIESLHKISYGMYIVCSGYSGKYNGQIVNTIFQITSEPALIAVSINKKNLTHEYLQHAKKFTVSILSVDAPMPFIGQFGFKSGREIDKFKGVNCVTVKSDIPIVLDHSIGYMEADIVNEYDCGTHTIFIGKVINAEITSDKEPMTYAYYHTVKKGLSPKNAPTYIKTEAESKGESIMEKFKCVVCGYIYDPEKGDPESGVKPGTHFKDIPDTWVCPVCGADKSQFVQI